MEKLLDEMVWTAAYGECVWHTFTIRGCVWMKMIREWKWYGNKKGNKKYGNPEMVMCYEIQT